MGMGFRAMIIVFVFSGLFMLAAISFAVESQLANNATTIDSDPRINLTRVNLERNISNTEDVAVGQRNIFEEQGQAELGIVDLIFESIIGIGRVFGSTIANFYNIVTFIIFDVFFGGNTGLALAVLGTLTTILTITIIFAAWRLYKTGE